MSGRQKQAGSTSASDGKPSTSAHRAGASNLTTLAVQLALRTGVLALLAAVLGPSGQGTVVLAHLVATIGAGVCGLGLETALTYAFARSDLREDAGSVALVQSVVVLTIVGAVLALSATVGFLGDALTAGVAALPGLLAMRLLAACALGDHRLGRYAAYTVGPYLLYAAVLAAAALIDRLDTQLALVAFPLCMTFSAVVAVLVSLRWLGRFRPVKPWGDPVYAVGVQVLPGNVAQLANYRLDQVIVAVFLSRTDLGLYSLAVAASEVGALPGQAAANVVLPRATSHRSLTLRRLRLAAPPVAAIAMISIPIFWLVTDVLLPAYGGALVPYLLLIPGVFGVAATKVLAAYVVARGDAWAPSRVVLFTMVLTVIANLILVPTLGIAGAAVASSAVYLASATMLHQVASKMET